MSARETSKRELRSAMRAVLSRLDERWVKAASQRVVCSLNAHIEEHPEIEHILIFASFFPGEVELTGVVDEQLTRGIKVYLPRTCSEFDNGNEVPSPLLQFTSVSREWRGTAQAGVLGLIEPEDGSGPVFDKHDAASTLVIVPGLAFDARGGRLGRGKGYYDRFLGSALMRRAHLIAVGWELQVVGEVPMQGHDVFMHQIITEDRRIECNLPTELVEL